MAKRTSGLKPLWKKQQITKLFQKVADRADFIVENLLARTGEEFVKVARLSGLYDDHTGNLRSSIGYVIVKDGKVTGRSNYEQISKAFGVDFITNPELLATPEYAVKSACWWWHSRKLNEKADLPS